jgi:hypothetical protein
MAIEMDADISLHIDASKGADAAVIAFPKIRQSAASFELPVEIRGWEQTITNRTKGAKKAREQQV